MTERAEPDLITSGPYRYVRHPIYSGILLGTIGTALALNLFWLIVLAILGVYFFTAPRSKSEIWPNPSRIPTRPTGPTPRCSFHSFSRGRRRSRRSRQDSTAPAEGGAWPAWPACWRWLAERWVSFVRWAHLWLYYDLDRAQSHRRRPGCKVMRPGSGRPQAPSPVFAWRPADQTGQSPASRFPAGPPVGRLT